MTLTTESDRVSVMILDSNKCLSKAIENSFNLHGGLHVSCSMQDGVKATEKLHLHKPDVLLMELILPVKDGFSVLEDVQQNDMMKHGSVIVTSSLCSDLAMRKSLALGADYFMLKPFDIDILIKRILEVHSEKQLAISSENEKAGSDYYVDLIRNFLFDSGVSIKLKGYDYLFKCIHICLNDDDAFYSLTKILYPEVGKTFGTEGAKAERAMRYALHSAWKNGKLQAHFAKLGYKDVENRRPTTGNFIKIALHTIKGR
jgi:two-component system response regulator (stage 0 sporulation protein A)